MSFIARSALVGTVVFVLAACGQGRDEQSASSEPQMTEAAPDDSTYTASAGRKEEGAAASAAASGQPLSATSRDFMVDAAQTDMLEIQAGQLAAQKAKSAEAKQFAAMLVQDHGAASKQLEQLAQAKGVEVPTSLSADQQESLKGLQSKSGTEFDRAFAREMVSGHQKAVQLYEQAAQSAPDPEVKTFATQQLPTLRQHLKMAQSLPGSDNRG